jgi:hypothetical protein
MSHPTSSHHPCSAVQHHRHTGWLTLALFSSTAPHCHIGWLTLALFSRTVSHVTPALFSSTAHLHPKAYWTTCWLEYSLQVWRWWRCQSKTKVLTLKKTLGDQRGRCRSGWRYNRLWPYWGAGSSDGACSGTVATLLWGLQATCMICMATPERVNTNCSLRFRTGMCMSHISERLKKKTSRSPLQCPRYWEFSANCFCTVHWDLMLKRTGIIFAWTENESPHVHAHAHTRFS